MSTDKTLADVQPGGRVRLATVPYDRARDLLGDAYNAGTHGIGYSQQIMELHDAVFTTRQPVGEPVAWRNHGAAIDAKALATATEISLMWGQDRSQFVSRIKVAVIEAMRWMDGAALSAQPSPGGQDALAALQRDYDKLLDSFNRQVEVAEKIAGRALQQDDRIEELEEALAARQPVGQQPEQPAGCDECPVTGLPFYGNMEHPERGLIAMYGGPLDVYSVPELQDNDGELRRERYDLDADCWVEGGEPLGYFYREQQPDSAAQAVDLGAMPEGWRLSKKATCYQLSYGNDIVGNLVGPDAEENAVIIARVLDSQAGK